MDSGPDGWCEPSKGGSWISARQLLTSASVIVPKSLRGVPDDFRISKPRLVVVEEGELVLGEDVGGGLSLQAAPDFV